MGHPIRSTFPASKQSTTGNVVSFRRVQRNGQLPASTERTFASMWRVAIALRCARSTLLAGELGRSL